MTDECSIWFSDLTIEAQKKVLEFYGVKHCSEMNWDTFPITILAKETE